MATLEYCFQTVSSYKPGKLQFSAAGMPLRSLWDGIEPHVYLALFSWLAPIAEGRRVLAEFANKAKNIYATPNYLAYVVLTPVLKIVRHLMDISVMEGVLEQDAKEKHAMKYHKYRHLVTHYVAKQYLLALIQFPPPKTQPKKDNCRKKDNCWKRKKLDISMTPEQELP